MKRSYSKLLPAALAALVLTSFAMASYADAAAARGGGGGGGGGARGGGGGGGGGQRQTAQVNNSKADARTNNVRNTSVNNVNVERNVNVDVDARGGGGGGCCCCGGGWDNDYHPVAAAAAVTAGIAVTSAIVGSLVRTVPANCVPVNYGGMVYQQCGSTWYQPQGSQYVVVNPPY
jgi:hypothetical protein